jgi:hypothetical protein
MATSRPSSSLPLPNRRSVRAWAAVQLGRLRRHAVVSVVVSLVVVVGTIGAFTTAIDQARGWSLDRCRATGLCAPPPPEWLVGNLTEVRLGAANVPESQAFAERNLPTPTGLPALEAAWPGQFITYRVEFRGLIGSVCLTKWTLLNAVTGERVLDQWANETGRRRWATIHARAYPDSRWLVEADQEDEAVGTLWVPYLAPGRYQVEVELLDARGEYLDIERTPAFTVKPADLPS